MFELKKKKQVDNNLFDVVVEFRSSYVRDVTAVRSLARSLFAEEKRIKKIRSCLKIIAKCGRHRAKKILSR